MSDQSYAKVQAQQKPSGSSPGRRLLQRTCACGQHTIGGAECQTCRDEQSSLLRSQRAYGPALTTTPPQENSPSVNPGSDGASHFSHDFSRIPVYSAQRVALQTKLKINQPGDVYEQEADQAAEQVMRVADPEIPASDDEGETKKSLMRKQSSGPQADTAADSSSVPPVVHAVLKSGGDLDTTTRAFMEPRFGYDFSGVRVHNDSQAAESARSVNALAYTVGRSVVFGAGQFAPQTTQGRRLLAHELAHVVQQTARAAITPGLFRKKDKTPALWYQEAVDRLKSEEKYEVQVIPGEGPMLRKFVALLKAVDEEDAAVVPKLLDDFITGDPSSLFSLFPSRSLASELITRMMLLGLNTESVQFRTWYLTHASRASIKSTAHKEYSEEVYLWEDLLERLTGRIPAKDADAAVKVLDALALLFDQLRNEAVGLDKEAINADNHRIKSITDTEDSGGLKLVPDMTISLYYAKLIEFLRQTFAGIQTTYQLVLDQAMADLGAGKGEKYLQVARDRLQKLTGLVAPADQPKQAGGVTLPVTRSEFEKGGGRHLDIFLQGKAAEKRSVKIHFYDVEMPEILAKEKELDFGRILAIRRQQIQVLEQLYGLEKDKTSGKPTEETKENKAAIARLGKAGFHLDSNDDWRKFLLEKFEAHRAASGNAAALTAVIELLKTYLQAFTTHTPYDIDDFGDNQLTLTFPRALTGQLLHDCGVYALRIAYMLSLLREHPDLQLRFRYIVLPVHIGLIITGKDLPLYIAHNDEFTIYSAADVKRLEEQWRSTDPQGKTRKTPSPRDEKQFLGELAGREFIPGTDLPFKMLDVPHLKGSPASMKRKLWHFYQTRAQTELFGPKTRDPKSPHFQFHLRYLEVLEMMRQHYNEWIVPFWNVKAHNAWLAQGPGLIKAWKQLQSARTSQEKSEAQQRYDKLAQDYAKNILAGLDEVDAAFNPIMLKAIQIDRDLEEHPEVIAKDIPITHSERLETIFGNNQWWQREVLDHLTAINKGQTQPDALEPDLLEPLD